jgi:2-polyprenyl-3-methyl-5-hydroxy-6-metoxy-1,4-benzoquinol methylase
VPGFALRLGTLGKDVLRRYRHASMSARWFLNARWRWTPYEQIASRVPARGLILDLGAGHGLLSIALALGSSERKIRGIDHDERRIAVAQKAAADLGNLEFKSGGLLDAVADRELWGAVSGIVVMDAMHYLTHHEQIVFLANARQALAPGGVLLIRDVDAAAGKNFIINRWHERIMTGLGFTRASQLHFRTQSDWLQVLAEAGFAAACEPCSRFPFADLLFTGTAAAVPVSQAG